MFSYFFLPSKFTWQIHVYFPTMNIGLSAESSKVHCIRLLYWCMPIYIVTIQDTTLMRVYSRIRIHQNAVLLSKCSWFRAQKYWSMVYILQILKKTYSIESWFFFMKKGIHIVNLKSKMKICHLTTFYSIFIMCSCRKPELQQDLPKITKNQMNF